MSNDIYRAQRIRQIDSLISEFGEGATLREIRDSLPDPAGHKCPRCLGSGSYTERYNAYPQNLPDSMFGVDMQTRKVTCDVCSGRGYTDKPLRPKMVQQGWE